MPYTKLHPVKQLDFQINRILTYGEAACDFDEVKDAAARIADLRDWYREWRGLGERAETQGRHLHAAYYYRLAEFFLRESPEKQDMYARAIENFHRVIGQDGSVRIEHIPYDGAAMKVMVFEPAQAKRTLVVFGGYDSFVEEFYLAVKEWSDAGYRVFLFEGPGQGETLQRGLHFEPHWEKPVGAVLDHFGLADVCVIGISWGGYLALRAAAFEPRIRAVVAYDILYDGYDCMTRPFPRPSRALMNTLFAFRVKPAVNALVRRAMQRGLLVQWAVEHGQYITGTRCPYDFYRHLKRHTLKGLLPRIHCDVLLLAGERDHYIPFEHYEILMRGLTNARTLTGRVFIEAEGGQEHCQVGNHQLAADCILDWIAR